eukprot:tig00000944_g5950.t1
MNAPEFSYPRYLAAKRTVDDRALNRAVLDRLRAMLEKRPADAALRVLEVGGGIGTMIERLLGERIFDRFDRVSYEMIDSNSQNILEAARRVGVAARALGYAVEECEAPGWEGRGGPSGALAEELAPGVATKHHHAVGTASNRAFARRIALRPPGPAGRAVEVTVRVEELEGALEAGERAGLRWDLLIAAAFLDLVDIPRTLPRLLGLLPRGGLFYFPINFDGATHLEPNLMGPFDDAVEACPAPPRPAPPAPPAAPRRPPRRAASHWERGSRAGRVLFHEIARAGGEVARAGGSSWAVHPAEGVYEGDEAYFLHCILHFIAERLAASPAVEAGRAAEYVRRRREQVGTGELVYVAHNLDFVGRRP